MKALLISLITENIYMTVLPLGAAYVSASVMNAGHDVEMLSLRSGEANHVDELKDWLKETVLKWCKDRPTWMT